MLEGYIFMYVGLICAIIGIIFIFKKPKVLTRIEIIWISTLFFWSEFSWGTFIYYKQSLLKAILGEISGFLFFAMIFFIICRPKVECRVAFILPCLIGAIYYLTLCRMCLC